MVSAYRSIARMMAQYKCSMRTAAFALAVQRVKEATDMRGLG
jgi:glutamate dehydrogenase/leucine dehydrogenase